MTRRSLAPLALAALALTASAASAQTPVPPPVPPEPGAASFRVLGGMGTTKARYYAPFQQVALKGRVKPFVAGQAVTLLVVREGEVVKRVRRSVRRRGRFAFRFRVGKPGGLRLVVRHPATPEQQGFRARDKRIQVVDWSAGEGARGVPVLLLQRRLLALGFATPVTGYYDAGTARAVLAFRKTNDMSRNGYAGTDVYGMLFRRRGAFKLRYPKSGKHVEFDWSRQVLVLADKGRPYRTYHTSSGAPATPTVFGTYRFYYKLPGTNAKGMVHSSFFIGGYAIHGYASVPSYPASHGCLRVPIPNAQAIFDWVEIGDTIHTYR